MTTPDINKLFYKKKLVANETGILVITEKYITIHETQCYYFCILERDKLYASSAKGLSESLIAYCRRRKIVNGIKKSGSRIAFETEEQALAHLRFLKQRQLQHLIRTQRIIEKFLATEILEHKNTYDIVPGSRRWTNDNFIFD